MTTALVAFGLAFVAAVLATLAVRRGARALGVLDRPDGFRKLDHRRTPLLGGIAIYLAFALPVVALRFFHQNAVAQLLTQNPARLWALMGGGAVALGLGIADDVKHVPARWKVLLQAAAACIAFAGGFSISAISHPFGAPLELGVLVLPATIFWFLACMNAVNLLDGLDGLAAGVCLFASVSVFLVSFLFGNVLSMLLMACLSGAILGFLLFNFHPASIFLGDSGSLLLGYLVGAVSLLGVRQAGATVSLLIPVVALGVPVFDTALAIVRRWWKRVPLASPDRGHVHHVLLSRGLTQRQVVVVIYVACVVLGGAALLLASEQGERALLVLGPLAVLVFAAVRIFGGVPFLDYWRRLRQRMADKQRARDARIAVEKVRARMQRSENLDELWDLAVQALAGLDLDQARLHLADGDPAAERVFTWRTDRADLRRASEETVDRWSADLKLQDRDRVIGALELHSSGRDLWLLPETPELLDVLREEMVTQLCRLSSPGERSVPSAEPELDRRVSA